IKLQIQVIAEALEKGRGAAREKEEPVKLTLADFVEILEAVESEESYEAARFFASHLDYGKLTEMARDYVTGADDDANNDPNKMPTRFMILYGADDNKLQQIDDHPDRFEGEEHKINVTNLRKGLKLLGYDVAEEGPYDDDVYRAHLQYMATVPPADPKALNELEDEDGKMKYVVKKDDNLGMIAHRFGLPSWKYLYELNRETISDNPDMLPGDIKICIPQWDSTGGDEKIEAKGAKAFTYTGGLRYWYVWMPYSVTMTDMKGELYRENDDSAQQSETFETEKEYIVTRKDRECVLVRGTIQSAADIKVLVPGAPDKRLFINENEFV
ncbi:MAG: LysM peptidoglycan-binding domain-containing protein, partial [Chitinispirillaceae bacterium]